MTIRPTLRVLLCATLMGSLSALAADTPPASRPAIDPQASALLQKMSDTLAAATKLSFSVNAISEQLLDSGQKIDVARNSAVNLQRPDRLDVSITGDNDDLHVVYDGKLVSINNLRKHVYGQISVPATIDGAIDTLADKYGMVIPLADFLLSNPQASLAPLIRSGAYLGTGLVFDNKCHHLAFRQDTVDWQIWLDQSDNLPRKIVITYFNTPDRLQYVAYFNKWNLAPDFAPGLFTFAPIPGDTRVEAVVSSAGAATQPKN